MSEDSAQNDLETGDGTQFAGLPAPPSVTALLYDADAEQRIELVVKRTVDGKTKKSKVAHILAPISDEQFFRYEDKKRVKTKVSGTDVLRLREEHKNLDAVEWLWNQLAQRREGYVKREDWKEKTNLMDKYQAIENGLFAVFPVRSDESEDIFAEEASDELLDDNEPFFDEDEVDDDAPTEIKLDCLFNSANRTTTHYFRQPSAQAIKKYNNLMRQADKLMDARGMRKRKGQQVAQLEVPSKARELVALYKDHILRTDGYVGRVPAHHMREAALELFVRETDVTEKN